VRMPTFSRHSSTTTNVDSRDETPAGAVRVPEQTDDRVSSARPAPHREPDQVAAQRDAAERSADRSAAIETKARPEQIGPRPRASLLATLSLVAGVAAAMLVLSGVLAGYGLALGVLAMVLAIGGMSATGRRHVAGKTDALIGLALGLAAVVFGILVVTGSMAWLGMDADAAIRAREWLDAQFVDRL